MHLWRRLGIVQVDLPSALALHKRSFSTDHLPAKLNDFPTNIFAYALPEKPVSSTTIRKIIFTIRKIIFTIRKIVFIIRKIIFPLI